MLVHKLWSRWWVGCECEGEGWVWSHRGVRALKRRLSDTKINFQNYRTQHLYKRPSKPFHKSDFRYYTPFWYFDILDIVDCDCVGDVRLHCMPLTPPACDFTHIALPVILITLHNLAIRSFAGVGFWRKNAKKGSVLPLPEVASIRLVLLMELFGDPSLLLANLLF